jgi:dihydrofolate synthase/folylpolyglutamate synthase
LNDTPLSLALNRIESLITRPAESYSDPAERAAEFQRRLERTHRLMECLGAPHRTLNAIHIGGTSGKGSIAMLCESVLREAGLRVGTHTSPYLQSSLEKVRVDGSLLTPQDAVALADEVMACVEAVHTRWAWLGAPHYAEAWLGMALAHFQKQHCEVGLVEVGMGGRYDCTNIITPSVSVISTVHYDHTLVLGETIAEIAYHKAGIIKPGIPVVLGEVASDEAVAQIEAEAHHRGARLLRLGREIQVRPSGFSLEGGTFSYRGVNIKLDDLRVGLLGRHQVANAAVALAALEVFSSTHGVSLDEEIIREGLAKARFAGRLEIMQNQPTVVLDGAHNQEKVGALVSAIPEVFRYRRLILVLGMLETKHAGPILEALGPLTDTLITTSPEVKGKPAVPADELAAMAREHGISSAVAVDAPREALAHALALAEADDLVVVTGSLYLIGEVRSHWFTVEAINREHTMFPGQD